MFSSRKPNLEHELEAKAKELEEKGRELRTKDAELASAAARADEAQRVGKLAEEKLEEATAERERLAHELDEAKRRLETSETTLTETKSALEGRLADTQRELQEARQKREETTSAPSAAAGKHFLDVAVGECEFASAFAYFVVLQVGEGGKRWSTDVSPPSDRPIFGTSSFLLPLDAPASESEALVASVYISVADPISIGAPPVVRLLGEARVPLTELQLPDAPSASAAARSKRCVRSVEFLRAAAANAAAAGRPAGGGPVASGGSQLVVGRATLVMQVKALSAGEAATAATSAAAAAAPLPASFPSLDRSLWLARPFQHRLRVLLHSVEGVPAPAAPAPDVDATGASRTLLRFALRLSRRDGQVLQESSSGDVPVVAGATGGAVDVSFGQEVVLPLPLPTATGGGDLGDLRAHLAIEMVSVSYATGAVSVASLLDLMWPVRTLQAFVPIHFVARPSEATSAATSFARPRPAVVVSLVREPAHESLGQLGAAGTYGAEVRLHGVPASRSLPDVVERALVALAPEPLAAGAGAAAVQIPVATFYYDQPMELGTFLESQSRGGSGGGPRLFLSPMVGGERTPHWGQFTLRCNATPGAVSNLSLLLFDCGTSHRRSPSDATSLGGKLLGFATLDASALLPASSASATSTAAAPTHRSYMLDLRLLEAPGAAASLEVEARIWQPGQLGAAGAGAGAASEVALLSARSAVSAASPRPEPGDEFRLNHDVSVHLAKEFNMRAAALKRAGEEIVGLRRQIQILEENNTQLKAQVDDEERLAEEVLRKPPPEGLDKLSSVELASKLHRALERYREEKARGTELSRRLEEVLREAARGRGLERALEQLEQAHLEQNRELQRWQEEGKKAETYRQTTRAQEKVITKLERILEGSLQEVQKAQRVQVDVERLKTENLRLRERQAQLVAARGAGAAMTGVSGVSTSAGGTDRAADVAHLETVVRDLQRQLQQQRSAVEGSAAAESATQLDGGSADLERERLEWEQRCTAAEQRWRMLQQQLTDSSRRYGAEIATLKVEVAKRDASIKELEYLLKEQGASGV
eukprot:TRINITY_DN22650_c0_g1_i2.p1 TRINITY_DN22650_c0_g1~~TRINITY_DN22650_c0_g1_i2.p1  ORF type:complete len:1049 (-),score=304.06 TRINITY_DN22650_c0_g1_i2:54-3200(-)